MSEDLKAYLGDRQNDAALIEGLLAAAMACISTGRHAMVLDLIDKAHDVAKQLNNDLDSASLPKGGDA